MKGPIYEVVLLDRLPLGESNMWQALPSAADLFEVREVSERTVAGYEVLLAHYYRLTNEVALLRAERNEWRAAAKVKDDALDINDRTISGLRTEACASRMDTKRLSTAIGTAISSLVSQQKYIWDDSQAVGHNCDAIRVLEAALKGGE